MLDGETLLLRMQELTDIFAAQRAERLARRQLDPADFERLRAVDLHIPGGATSPLP